MTLSSKPINAGKLQTIDHRIILTQTVNQAREPDGVAWLHLDVLGLDDELGVGRRLGLVVCLLLLAVVVVVVIVGVGAVWGKNFFIPPRKKNFLKAKLDCYFGSC